MYLLWILRPCLDNKLLNCSNAGLSLCCSWVQPRAHYTSACLLGSPRLGTLSPFCPAVGSEEEQHISFCFRYVFAGANHQAGFSPWRAIGWFNTMPTGKRRQAANCVQSRGVNLWLQTIRTIRFCKPRFDSVTLNQNSISVK